MHNNHRKTPPGLLRKSLAIRFVLIFVPSLVLAFAVIMLMPRIVSNLAALGMLAGISWYLAQGSIRHGQTRKALFESNETLRKLARAIEYSPVSIVITDLKGDIEYVNPAFTSVTGYSVEEALGQNPRILKSGNQSPTFYRALWDTISKGATWQGEFENRKKNGEFYWERAWIAPVHAGDGRITHYVAVKEDVTEQRLKDLELRHAKETAEEAHRMKSRFLSSMSHELRTPLNGILGFANLLKDQFYGELNARQEEYVDLIEVSGKHLLALITDLLDIAKIDAGAMDTLFETLEPSQLVNEPVSIVRSQIVEKGIHLKTYTDPAITAVKADARKYRQIALNLLSNAIKYTPEGGAIEMRAERRDESTAVVSVRDTGIGIDPSKHTEIFSEFYQVDSVRDAQMGGTGIGLALTRRLVELHHGTLGVESKPGEGSTFWFTVQIIPGTEKEDDEGGFEMVDLPPGRRILLAEDNKVNQTLMRGMLERFAADVEIAGDGREAIECARRHPPELILMDIQMPVMDGFEATSRLRAMPEFKEVPIIALTASAEQETIDRCLEAGCNLHLSKPIERSELVKALRTYLASDGRKGHSK